MSMTGRYLRIPPEVLAELRARPDEIHEILYPEDGESSLDIDKAWHAIHFLLNGQTWEGDVPLLDAVLGGEPIGEEDLGYGPARSLDPHEVAAVADAIEAIPPPLLLERFDADAMNEAEIYPQRWTDDDVERGYIADNYRDLIAFFRRATDAGEAMILFLA